MTRMSYERCLVFLANEPIAYSYDMATWFISGMPRLEEWHPLNIQKNGRWEDLSSRPWTLQSDRVHYASSSLAPVPVAAATIQCLYVGSSNLSVTSWTEPAKQQKTSTWWYLKLCFYTIIHYKSLKHLWNWCIPEWLLVSTRGNSPLYVSRVITCRLGNQKSSGTTCRFTLILPSSWTIEWWLVRVHDLPSIKIDGFSHDWFNAPWLSDRQLSTMVHFRNFQSTRINNQIAMNIKT